MRTKSGWEGGQQQLQRRGERTHFVRIQLGSVVEHDALVRLERSEELGVVQQGFDVGADRKVLEPDGGSMGLQPECTTQLLLTAPHLPLAYAP